ncbi:hypothetical protein GEOBRER4_n0808 [Citrifermentans bremense]|uniref:Uncharacterized protein n=1 Tax=Citrifermentans bremense TaxID=60035 RepID=A0A7R7FRX0_9BACT|nr:hypothetical protein GEOBRER4_n0808 [Citrifermentans bremense]
MRKVAQGSAIDENLGQSWSTSSAHYLVRYSERNLLQIKTGQTGKEPLLQG